MNSPSMHILSMLKINHRWKVELVLNHVLDICFKYSKYLRILRLISFKSNRINATKLILQARDRSQGKNLRDKFERWEFSTDEEKQLYEKQFMIPESEEIQASLNTAKNLRAHFEQLQKEPSKPAEKPRIKVNRFA